MKQGRGRPKRENGETVTYIQIHKSVFDKLDAYCKKNRYVKVRIISDAVSKYLEENK